MTALRDLDNAALAAREWIDDLMRHLDWHDRERVYSA
jgi:hypothetical protein